MRFYKLWAILLGVVALSMGCSSNRSQTYQTSQYTTQPGQGNLLPGLHGKPSGASNLSAIPGVPAAAEEHRNVADGSGLPPAPSI